MSDPIDTSRGTAPAGIFSVESELELLNHDTEKLRTFYSLSGPARKEFILMMAEAEAAKVAAIADAEAKGLLSIRKAEAEGYKLLGEALASLPNAREVLELARLYALANVAKSLADGRATKMFLPQSMDSLMGLLTVMKDVQPGVPQTERSPIK